MEFHFAGVGTLINVVGIIIGGLIGLFGGKFLTVGIRRTLQDGCALAVIFLGAYGALKSLDTLLLIASLIVGGLIWAIIDIDGKFERLWIFLRTCSGNDGDKKFVDVFVRRRLRFVSERWRLSGRLSTDFCTMLRF